MTNFLKYQPLYFLISLVVIGVGLFSIWRNGFLFSLDFSGGSLVEFVYTKQTKTDKEQIKNYLKQKQPTLNYQGTSSGLVLSGKKLTAPSVEKLTKDLKQKFSLRRVRFEEVGPSVSSENIQKTIVASLIAVLGILLYVAFTYQGINFGLGAVASLIHDFLVLLGVWSVFGYWFGFEFDVLFITSLLTTMSFSVHDTIVIFDKIQEEAKHTSGDLETTINLALNLTMTRSLNNSLTVVLMLSSLLILGGQSIAPFAAALLIGTITGTYSSPFVAAPVYYFLEKRRRSP